MKVERIGDAKVVMSNPHGKHKYFAWPTVARLRDGRIAVAASGFRIDHICPFGKAVLSFLNGEGYTAPTPIIDTVLDDRDSGLCPFGKSGLILTSFNNSTEFQRKINEKCTAPIKKAYIDAYLDSVTAEEENAAIGSLFRVSYDNGNSFSEIYKSPVTSPHGPTELKNGEILWVGAAFSGEKRIFAYKLCPESGEMKYLSEIDTGEIRARGEAPAEPYVAELDDGTLICHIRTDKSGEKPVFTLYQSFSYDGGMTWTKPGRLHGDLGGAPSHILRHSSGVLICTFSYREKPQGIKALFSHDGGKTWQNEVYLYESGTGTRDLGYPSTVELEDGSLITVFYEKHAQYTSDILEQKWKFEE